MSGHRTLGGDGEERLALAKRVWSAARPSEDEVERAVGRISRAMRGSRRPQARRKITMFTVAVAAMTAALAYAANGAYRWGKGNDEGGAGPAVGVGSGHARHAEESAPVALPVHGELLVLESRSAPALAESAGSGPTASKKDVAKPRGVGAREAPSAREATAPVRSPETPGAEPGEEADSAAARREASWRAVSRALQANDHGNAERLLQELADQGGDAVTRGKATLGLAQMYAARGDCERVIDLAKEIAEMPGVDRKTVMRARALAARCGAAAGP